MLSVIICTRNRAEKLAQCLSSFEGGTIAKGDWELLVIDNGSQDHTRQVISHIAERKTLPLTYVAELHPGLSHARNRGIAHATGDIVVFTDDDCLISPTWLDSVVQEFTHNAKLMVLGGRVDLADPHDVPIGIRPFPDQMQICSFEQIMERLIGCNMAFRRNVFHTVGLFDPRLGAGTRVGSAEDTDIFYRAIKAGMSTWYSPAARIWHAHGRVDDATVSRLKDSYVRGRGALYSKHLLQGDRLMLKYAFYEIRSLLHDFITQRKGTTREYTPGRALRNLAYGAFSRVYHKK